MSKQTRDIEEVTQHLHDYRCKYVPNVGWRCPSDTQQKYRISFEFVNPTSHPQAYRGDNPCVPAAIVPEDWWHRVERESYDLSDVQSQLAGLNSEIARGELIRNPVIERATLTWEPLS